MCVPDVVTNINSKVFNLVSRTNEMWHIKLLNENVDYIEVFVILNKDGAKKNVDVNIKNWLIKVDMMKDLFRILVTVNVNVINHVI